MTQQLPALPAAGNSQSGAAPYQPPSVAYAPPPPPAASTYAGPSGADLPAYEPRHRVFFCHAINRLYGALRPSGFQTPSTGADRSDEAMAMRTAEMCARALDRGVLPENFLLPRLAPKMPLIEERETLRAAETNQPLRYADVGKSAHAGEVIPPEKRWSPSNPGGVIAISADAPKGGVHPPTMPEGVKAKLREKHQRLDLPSREELMEQNRREIEMLAHVSDAVRSDALDQSCQRIGRAGFTGAQDREALAIVTDAMLQCATVYTRYGLPSRLPLDEAERAAQGASAYAWPTARAIEVSTEAAAALAATEARAALDGFTSPPSPTASAPESPK